MNGCDWRFEFGAGERDEFGGGLGIACPAGQAIVIAGFGLGCEIQIPEQSGLSAVSYENLTTATPKSKVAVVMNITNLRYNKTKGNPEDCFFEGLGTMNDGALTASVTLAGKEKSGANALPILIR